MAQSETKPPMALAVKIVLAIIALLIVSVSVLAVQYLRPSKRLARYYAKGYLYLQQGKFSPAIKEFKQALAIDPKHGEVHFQLANAYLANEQKDSAIDELEKTIGCVPDHAKAYELLIEIITRDAVSTEKKEIKDERFQKALSYCDKLIEVKPTNIHFWNVRARTLFIMGETKKAELDLEKAISISPKESESYVTLSQVYMATQRSKEGLALLEKYIAEINQTDFDARFALGNDYLNMREYKQAIKHLRYLYENKPDDFMRVAPNYTLSLLGDNIIEEAVAISEKGLNDIKVATANRAPRTATIARAEVAFTYVLGSAQFLQRKYKDCIQNLLKVKNQLPQFIDIAYKLAISYLETGTNHLAIEELRSGIEKNPKATLLRITLIQALSNSNEWEKAEKECDALLQEEPENLEARRLKARIFLAQGQDDKAREIYREIGKMDPKSSEGQMGLALIEIGRNKFAQALPILRNLEKEKPKEAPVNFLIAQCQVGLNDLEAGLDYINRTLDIDPAFTAARVLLARIRMFQSAPQLAANELEALQKSYPKNPQITLELVFLYLRMGEADKAMDLLNKVEKELQASPIFQETKARIHFAKGEAEKALEILTKLPNQTAPQKMLLGNAYTRLGKYPEAIEAFQKANLIDPNTQVNIPIAVTYYLQKSWKESIESLEQHLKIEPNAYPVRVLKALLHIMANQLPEAAEEVQQTFKEDNTNQWLSRITLSAIYVAQKKFDAAQKEIDAIPGNLPYLKDFKSLIAYCQTTNRNFNPLLEAIILRELGNREESLAKCIEAVKLLPEDRVVEYIYSMTLLDMESQAQREEGKKILEKLTLSKDTPLYMYTSLARAYSRENDYAKAEECYEKALKLNPEASDIALALGMLYETQKKINDAIDHYKKILDMTKTDKEKMAALRSVALNNLAWLCLEETPKRDPKFALACAQESFENARYNWAIADTYGWAYYYNNDYEKAAKYLLYAKNLKPDYPTIYFHLAKVYLKQNNKKDAREALKKALDLSNEQKQEFREIKETRELLDILAKEPIQEQKQ